MTYQLNLFEGVQLCLNVDTANYADATYPSTTDTVSGVTSAYNDTPSQPPVKPVTETSTYQTTNTEPSLLPYLESISTIQTEQWWWRLYNSLPNGVL